MAKKKKRTWKQKSDVKPTYTYDERIAILRFWDDHDMDAELTMSRFNVGRSTLFLWKKKFWQDMLDAKGGNIANAKQANEERKTSAIVPVAEQKKIDTVKRKATNATEQIFDLILFKLERETEFMQENPDKFGNIKVHELSKLLDVAASFVLPKATPEPDKGLDTMEKKYSRITQYIQNNFKFNENGNKTNPAKGNGSLVTIHPRSGNQGGSNGHSESQVQE